MKPINVIVNSSLSLWFHIFCGTYVNRKCCMHFDTTVLFSITPKYLKTYNFSTCGLSFNFGWARFCTIKILFDLISHTLFSLFYNSPFSYFTTHTSRIDPESPTKLCIKHTPGRGAHFFCQDESVIYTPKANCIKMCQKIQK